MSNGSRPSLPEPSGPPPRKRRSPRSKGRALCADRGRRSSRTPRQHCELIYRELQEIVDDLLARNDVPANFNDVLKVRLEMDIRRRDDRASSPKAAAALRTFTDRLLEQVQELAQGIAIDRLRFPSGRVYCFWCGGFECPHASPPESRSVFKAYSATGEPIWTEFAALALESRHPRIESVYQDNAAPVTLTQTGSYVTRDQLGVYGKHSTEYRILGQVLVGYIPILWRGSGNENRGRSRVALTIQAVETNHSRRRHHLNVVGITPGGETVSLFLEESVDSRFCDALAHARASLAELALTGAPSPRAPATRGQRSSFRARERLTLRILTRLARNIERIYRQSSRRTNHARERHRDRGRPASTALQDALQANSRSIFRDVREGTWVVVGRRSRVHVFNNSGKHVTSVVYSGETIRKRTKQGKWRPGNGEDLDTFRENLRRLVGT